MVYVTWRLHLDNEPTFENTLFVFVLLPLVCFQRPRKLVAMNGLLSSRIPNRCKETWVARRIYRLEKVSHRTRRRYKMPLSTERKLLRDTLIFFPLASYRLQFRAPASLKSFKRNIKKTRIANSSSALCESEWHSRQRSANFKVASPLPWSSNPVSLFPTSSSSNSLHFKTRIFESDGYFFYVFLCFILGGGGFMLASAGIVSSMQWA